MRVLVVGGGVAGSASAIALRRIGAEVTVYEAYEDPSGPIGSFVSLAANGLRGLDVLGCLGSVQHAGFAVPRQRMWSGTGKLLADVPRGRPEGDPLHSVTLMRADLVTVLREKAVRSGARFVTGRRLDTAALVGEQADLVVGADGIWSATRRLVDPGTPEPAYAGTYTVSGVSDGLGLAPSSFNMIFARRGAFLHVTAPDGATWWSAQIASAAPPNPHTVQLGDLRALFHTEPQAVAILDATRDVHSATLNHLLPRLPRGHNERMVLIGDAAHPAGAGQGASMAIEDAVVLAQRLHHETTISTALVSYGDTRRPRAEKMARAATTNRDAKTAGPIAARLRDLVMPVVFPRVYPRATGWLYTYDPGTLPCPLPTRPTNGAAIEAG
jgi:salicylate hydroxylase